MNKDTGLLRFTCLWSTLLFCDLRCEVSGLFAGSEAFLVVSVPGWMLAPCPCGPVHRLTVRHEIIAPGMWVSSRNIADQSDMLPFSVVMVSLQAKQTYYTECFCSKIPVEKKKRGGGGGGGKKKKKKTLIKSTLWPGSRWPHILSLKSHAETVGKLEF